MWLKRGLKRWCLPAPSLPSAASNGEGERGTGAAPSETGSSAHRCSGPDLRGFVRGAGAEVQNPGP